MSGALRLTALHPRWLGAGGAGVSGPDGQPRSRREGCGIMLDCPCGDRSEGHQLFVPFANPLDGGPCLEPKGWQRTGDTFETLTLTPSIQRMEDCRWHGFITNGEVRTC